MPVDVQFEPESQVDVGFEPEKPVDVGFEPIEAPKAKRKIPPDVLSTESLQSVYSKVPKGSAQEAFKPFPGVEAALESKPVELGTKALLSGIPGNQLLPIIESAAPGTTAKVAEKLKGAVGSVASPGGVALGVLAPVAPELAAGLGGAMSLQAAGQGVKEIVEAKSPADVFGGIVETALGLGGAAAGTLGMARSLLPKSTAVAEGEASKPPPLPKEEIKPAPAAPEQAPEIQAPTEPKVSQAEVPPAAATTEGTAPAITETTTPVREAQPTLSDNPIGPSIYEALSKGDRKEAQRLADTLADPNNRGLYTYSDAGNLSGMIANDIRASYLTVRGEPIWKWIQRVRDTVSEDTKPRGGSEVQPKAAETTTPTPAAQVEPAGAPSEIIGMGGASPKEFEPISTGPTAMKYKLIDQERAQRGLPPLLKTFSREDGAVLDQAIHAIDQDPALPDRLVSELTTKPRPISDVENHVLMLRKIELRQEYEKAVRDINQAAEDGRTDDVAAATLRRADWSDKLTDLEEASRSSGSERGRALRSLQVMAHEDFSLARMESEVRAAKGGRRLTPKEQSDVEDIAKQHEKLTEQVGKQEVKAGEEKVQREIEAMTKEKPEKSSEPLDKRREKIIGKLKDRVADEEGEPIGPLVQKLARTFVEEGIRDRDALVDAVHNVLKEFIPEITRRDTMDAISGYGSYASLTKDQVSVALRDLKGQLQQIAKLEDMAAKKAPLRTGVERRTPTPEETRLIKLVNEAKRKGGYETTDPTRQLRSALEEVKKRTGTAIAELERRMREKDFTVRRLEPVRPDDTLLRLQATLKRTRKRFDQMKRDAELENRATWQKMLDKFVRWERAFKLSSPVVFGKLTGAAITRVAATAAEETVGTGLSKIPGISQVAERAPREGPMNVKAAAKALATATTEGMKDAWDTATKGAANIDVLYGDKLVDKDWANVFGQMHGMLKAPVKRAEFEYALTKRLEFNMRNGVDVTNPLVLEHIKMEALNDGYRAIFMQKGFSSDMFNTMVGIMERSKKYQPIGEIGARTLRFLMPVVRVPANIVAETATGIYGAPMASARTMFHAINGTLAKLDPVVADSIMRQFKKGSIGLGLMAVGYFSPENIGGYDWREKRRAGAPKTGGFQLFGQNVPRWMTHAPWFELMQFGATIRHVSQQHIKGEAKGFSEGMVASELGLIEETPFIGQMLRVDKLFQTPSERRIYAGELARGTLIPQVIQWIAKLSDQSPNPRKARTMGEELEMGIPGLRQNVPVKPQK